MTTSETEFPLGKRDLDTSTNPDTGMPHNVTLSDVFAKVYLEPGEASRLLTALGILIDGDVAAGQHLRYVAAEVGNPANYTTPTRSTSTSTSKASSA